MELPNDRTDMKFTCPACHKVHRVTVTISTPGEDPPPPKPESKTAVTRLQTQMPKKYATGAYPPVVDIPIDANFVLLDGSQAAQPGIDLSAATEPAMPKMDSELSQRQTEIIRNPDPAKDRSRSATSSDANAGAGRKDDIRVNPDPETSTSGRNPGSTNNPGNNDNTDNARTAAEDRPEGRKFWDEVTEKQESAPSQSASAAPGASPDAMAEETAVGDEELAGVGAGSGHSEPPRYGDSARPHPVPPKRRGRTVLWLLFLVVLAAAGYFGWQQYQFITNRKTLDSYLAWADSSWKQGDIRAAADAARNAAGALDNELSLNTVEQVLNKLASRTGWLAPIPTGREQAAAAIDTHLQ
ncbi:MAG: hypothetical protein LIP23_01585, partial [Planctomycetes bacterium]|nr:hypothetical protein [Planctomycetota bacterium]